MLAQASVGSSSDSLGTGKWLVGKDLSQDSEHTMILSAHRGSHKRYGYSDAGRSPDGETYQRRSDRRNAALRERHGRDENGHVALNMLPIAGCSGKARRGYS